jgi:hypothetical protein
MTFKGVPIKHIYAFYNISEAALPFFGQFKKYALNNIARVQLAVVNMDVIKRDLK